MKDLVRGYVPIALPLVREEGEVREERMTSVHSTVHADVDRGPVRLLLQSEIEPLLGDLRSEQGRNGSDRRRLLLGQRKGAQAPPADDTPLLHGDGAVVGG